MIFQQQIKLSISGSAKSLGDISIDENTIKVAAGYAGSYHVLEMGQHYIEYSNAGTAFPIFSLIPTFPPANIFQQLTRKSRAAGITGNIGEIISAIVANRTLGFETENIAHLVVKDKKKTPDYLLYKTDEFCDLLVNRGIANTTECGAFPEWWLMESKAVTSGSISSSLKDAFRQIALFWYRMLGTYEEGIGFGTIIGTVLQQGIINIVILIPKNQDNLISFLSNFEDEAKYREQLDDKDDKLESTFEFLKNE